MTQITHPTMASSTVPSPLWRPNAAHVQTTAMYRFMQAYGPTCDAHEQNACKTTEHGQTHADLTQAYIQLHRWSVEHGEQFWSALLAFAEITHAGSTTPVFTSPQMPASRFFPNLSLNFAANLLRFREDHHTQAVVSISESRPTQQLTYAQLHGDVVRMRATLMRLGVTAHDRVAAYIPNIHETVIAMLGATSLGAMWSSTSPDFGVQGVLDRFGQIAPKVLFVVNAYTYNGKVFDCTAKIAQIAAALPSLQTIVMIPLVASMPTTIAGFEHMTMLWQDAISETSAPGHNSNNDNNGDDANNASANTWELFPFNHPLYIMYSSGTTGVPKCIVHGAGGTLLQHAKELLLHCDLRRGDNIMYFTTCGWMMWNWLISSLFVGATVTLFDGAPTYPSKTCLWDIVQTHGITHFGTSPKFLGACRTEQPAMRIAETHTLDRLRVILSTGSPLLPEDFTWIYDAVKANVQLSSISGGTDIISCFMLGNPLLPVVAGEIQCIGLGMDVAAYDISDQPVWGEKGELVCRKPFASMPVGFWNDAEHHKLKAAYFSHPSQPHTWFHGDYIAITGTVGHAGGITVYGRSDATLNPGGVRIGTAEIYRLVETLPEITDSIVIGQPYDGDVRVVLFVQLAAAIAWSDDLATRIKKVIRAGATPRHVPAIILPVSKIPYTISGKKVELAVLELVQGREPKNKDALADASALDDYRRAHTVLA